MVKLLRWQAIVLYRIHVGIINIQGTIGCLFQDGVVVDNEGIVQITGGCNLNCVKACS